MNSSDERTNCLTLISNARSMKRNICILSLKTSMTRRKRKWGPNSCGKELNFQQSKSTKLQTRNWRLLGPILTRGEKSRKRYLKNWKQFLRELIWILLRFEKKHLTLEDFWVKVRMEELESMMLTNWSSTWKINSDKRKRLLINWCLKMCS